MKKFNLILPISGKSQRFLDAGFKMPKPLILAKNKHVIDWSMDSIDYNDCNLIFLVRLDHVYNFSIDKILEQKYGPDIKVIVVEKITRGTLETCLLAKDYIDNSIPLIIYTPDVYFEPQFNPNTIADDVDGFLLTFVANSPDHSYCVVDNGVVSKVAEKEVISNQANVGIYYFKHGCDFVKYGQKVIDNAMTVNNEFYVAPMYNLLINDGLKITASGVEKMHVLGTPQSFNFFVNHVINKPLEKPIALSCDHSGFDLKEQAKNLLEHNNIAYIDVGTYVDRSCDYYDYFSQLADLIKTHSVNFGISFCRSGQGMNISANKTNGIISALVFDNYTAEFAIRHNCANHFSIPSKYVDAITFNEILMAIKNNSFDGGRHYTRLEKFICS